MIKKCFSTLLIIFMLLLSISANAVTINVLDANTDYTLIEFLLEDYQTAKIEIDDSIYTFFALPSMGLRLEKGNPELPIYAKSLLIPPQAKMHVQIIEQSFTEIPGTIIPSKGSLPRSINPASVPLEFSSIYQTDEFFPKNIVELNDPYIMREFRGIAFRVSPFAVNPVSETIRIYNRIVFKVYADGEDVIDVLVQKRDAIITKDFIPVYQNHFLNFNHVRSRYTSLEEKGSILVICFPAFMEAMTPYVDWKNQKGIKTEMVSSTLVGTTPEEIKSFIINYWDENQELAFVQLVGDAAQIPTEMRNAGSGNVGGSDPAYVMINGTNSYPDLFIGRFSAETLAHVVTQVNKTIYYERDLIEGDWLEKGLAIASDEGGGWNGWNGWSDITFMNHLRDFLLGYTYTHVDQLYDPGVSASQVSNVLNDGRGTVMYTGHGLNTSWGTSGFNNNGVNSLINDWKLPHIVSVACLNGNFTATTCFAEAWLRATNNSTGAPTGAIATYMSTISQPWNEPMPSAYHIAELLSSEQKFTIGGLYFNGSSFGLDTYPNISGQHTIRTWHIFGDASLMIRTLQPYALNVESMDVLLLGAGNFTVKVDQRDALVALYDPESKTLIASAYTNETGNVTLNFAPFTTPTKLLLTITALNRITAIKEIPVIDNNQPYLLFNDFNYAAGSSPTYGTTATINLTVYNIGGAVVNDVFVALETDDPYITLINNESFISTINGEAYYTINNAFTFDIAVNIPDQHIVEFKVAAGTNVSVAAISDRHINGETPSVQWRSEIAATESPTQWHMSFPAKFNAPIIRFEDLMIVEINGNGNGRLDPGERAEIRIPFKNTGHATTSNGIISLNSSNPDVTIQNSIYNISAINTNGTNYAVFTLDMDENMDYSSRVSLGFFAQFSNQNIQSNFILPVGLLVEDFETGDLSKFNWENTGIQPWTVTSDNAYQGTYSLSAGNIVSNQACIIEVVQTINAPSVISFNYKVSSQSNVDFLQFYVNNSMLMQWSGEIDWNFADFPVPSGTNRYRWVYRKGASGSSGQDKAWIDMVTFPISGGSDFTGGIFYTPDETVDFENAYVDGVFTKEIYLVNFGNGLINGNTTIPDGFVLQNQAGSTVTTFSLYANYNEAYTLVFSPTVQKDYSGDIVFTTNSSEHRVRINAIAGPNNLIDITAPVTALLGNFPNPFNPETTIRFNLAKQQQVQISIYNIRGQLVNNLVNTEYDSGEHSVIWRGIDNNGRSVSSGVYFYRFTTADYAKVNRMLLMK